jgi:hypothetical protein
MQDRPPIVAFRAYLTTLVRTRAEPTDAALREHVCAVCDDLRSLGWPPERVIIGVKQLAREAGLRPSVDLLRVGGTLNTHDAVLSNIVRWCIERYYR